MLAIYVSFWVWCFHIFKLLLAAKIIPAVSNNGITDLRSKLLSGIECHPQFLGAPSIDESYSTPHGLVYDRSVVPLPPFLPVDPGTHTQLACISCPFLTETLEMHRK